MRFCYHCIKHSIKTSQETSALSLSSKQIKTAMLDPPSSPTIPPPPPSLPKSNLPMLYYGLVVVATAAIVLVLYNLVVVKWCADLPDHRPPQRSSPPSWRINNAPMIFVSSFEYTRDGKAQDGGGDSECAVCLSVFEEGEEIRQLPKCKHYFHAPCIDMWLYSHLDCPLCRSPVEPPLLHRHAAAEESEHSREGLLGPVTLV